jgi:dephospho-CoA kinase
MNNTLSINVTGSVASGKTYVAETIYSLFREIPFDNHVAILRDENTYLLNGVRYTSSALNKELERLGSPKILLISTATNAVA